jgi:hypothetical protein
VTHAARKHATWSASASARNFACPGALAFVERFGLERPSGEAAAWGTCCHEVAEVCLRDNLDASEFLDQPRQVEGFSFVFDEEMADTTQTYLDYVRGRLVEYASDTGDQATLLIEQKFSLDGPLALPMQVGGTGDAVLLFPAWGLVEVVDLKTGKRVVQEAENKQLRTYALGALIANPGKAWRQVRSTIVQPRVGRNAVRSETLDVIDLFDWTVDLKEAVNKAAGAREALGVGQGDRNLSIWAAAFLKAGDHCDATFCDARAVCPALRDKAMSAALTHFKPVGEIPAPPDPKTLPPEKVAVVLDAADMIEGWLNAVRAYGRELVERGVAVGDYVLVPKQGRRKWSIADEAELVTSLTDALLEQKDVDHEDLYERKLRSPAQVEKVLGKKRHGLIAHLWKMESSGFNLARADKTTRQAVTPPALSLLTKEN